MEEYFKKYMILNWIQERKVFNTVSLVIFIITVKTFIQRFGSNDKIKKTVLATFSDDARKTADEFLSFMDYAHVVLFIVLGVFLLKLYLSFESFESMNKGFENPFYAIRSKWDLFSRFFEWVLRFLLIFPFLFVLSFEIGDWPMISDVFIYMFNYFGLELQFIKLQLEEIQILKFILSIFIYCLIWDIFFLCRTSFSKNQEINDIWIGKDIKSVFFSMRFFWGHILNLFFWILFILFYTHEVLNFLRPVALPTIFWVLVLLYLLVLFFSFRALIKYDKIFAKK